MPRFAVILLVLTVSGCEICSDRLGSPIDFCIEIDEGEDGSDVEIDSDTDGFHYYAIGNSLTWDSQPEGVEGFGAFFGEEITAGYHINCGQSLPHIFSHPEEVCVAPVEEYHTFQPALTKHRWDAVTIQPHDGVGSDFALDLQAIQETIDLNGRDRETVYYIYASWPDLAEIDRWADSFDVVADTMTVRRSVYFDALWQYAQYSFEDYDVRLIPVGEVIYRLNRLIDSGEFPGDYDLYRDVRHLSRSLGRYAAGLTTAAVLTGQSPIGAPIPSEYESGNTIWKDIEVIGTVQRVIHEVLSEDPRTGVSL